MGDPKPRPRLLFLSLTNNDGANGPVAEFGRLGCECAVMSPPGFTCARSRFVARHFHLSAHRGVWRGLLSVQSALERASRDWRPDLVVALDDVAAWLLRGLAVKKNVSAELRGLLEVSLGAPAGYDVSCSRARFLELATRIGVSAPKSRAVTSSTALETATEIGYPVMLKLEHSCAGFGVKIAETPEELKAAIVAAGFGGLASTLRYWALLKRGKEVVRRIVWRFAGLRTTAKTAFELQQFVRGVGAMRAVSVWRGRVLAGVSFEKLCVYPEPFGPSTVIRIIEHPEMEAAVERIVAAVGYSGFAHFDFVIEEGTDRAFVIEMNSRATASAHLGRQFGHDLCGAMARQLRGSDISAQSPARSKETLIVRFPRELERDPESAWLKPGSGVLHDVPWDDPPVYEAYYRRLLRRRPEHAPQIAQRLDSEARAVKASA